MNEMTRKKKPLPLLKHVFITDVAAEGKAIAKFEGMVVFVPYGVPGDEVDLQVKRKKHNFMEAEIVHIHKPSSIRVAPFCRHFGICGGCKWQCLPYKEQLKYKQQQVEDVLTRIGKITLPKIQPILGSRHVNQYRNKLEFGFSNKKWLTSEQIASGDKFDVMDAIGFHIPGAFDKILDIETCFLMDDINNRLRNAIRDYALLHRLAFYDLRANTGLLRNMMIRTSATGEIMLLLQFCIHSLEEKNQAFGMMDHVHQMFPEVSSLLYVNNLKLNDTIGDLEVQTFVGTDFIYETMEDLRFKVGPKSFYQTNTEQAYELYKVARTFADLKGEELVYDLYTGTGTIANFIAKDARWVVGIEYVPEAIEDAKENASLNGLDNTSFFAGDMKDILCRKFIEENGHPDVIITDPPRAGMHLDVIETIRFAAPRRIVYVSCNPATQARDLQLLNPDFEVTAVQPIDMFPQTHHVENVVCLKRREGI